MSRHSWKAAEREIARRLGGERVPVTGRVRGYAPDIEHPMYALEVKTRKRMPVLLADAMDQASKASVWALAKGKGHRMPMVVIHADGTHFDNALVVVRLKDARDWWGVGDKPVNEEAI